MKKKSKPTKPTLKEKSMSSQRPEWHR